MDESNEEVTYQAPEGGEDLVLSDDEQASLSPLEIAERKVDFYKNLARVKGQTKATVKPLSPKGKDSDVEARFNEIDQKVELRMDGHSPDEVREIEAYAKGRGISLTEAAKSPFVRSALEAIRAEKTSKSVPMEPSNRSVMVGDKSASDVINDPNATASDKQAAHEARVQAMMNKRR